MSKDDALARIDGFVGDDEPEEEMCTTPGCGKPRHRGRHANGAKGGGIAEVPVTSEGVVADPAEPHEMAPIDPHSPHVDLTRAEISRLLHLVGEAAVDEHLRATVALRVADVVATPDFALYMKLGEALQR